MTILRITHITLLDWNAACRYVYRNVKTRHKNIGQMLTMMRSLKNEGQLKEFLQLQTPKRNVMKCFKKKRRWNQSIKFGLQLRWLQRIGRTKRRNSQKERWNFSRDGWVVETQWRYFNLQWVAWFGGNHGPCQGELARATTKVPRPFSSEECEWRSGARYRWALFVCESLC